MYYFWGLCATLFLISLSRLPFKVVVAERMSGASMYELVSSVHLLHPGFSLACFHIVRLICSVCVKKKKKSLVSGFLLHRRQFVSHVSLFAPAMLRLHLIGYPIRTLICDLRWNPCLVYCVNVRSAQTLRFTRVHIGACWAPKTCRRDHQVGARHRQYPSVRGHM